METQPERLYCYQHTPGTSSDALLAWASHWQSKRSNDNLWIQFPYFFLFQFNPVWWRCWGCQTSTGHLINAAVRMMRLQETPLWHGRGTLCAWRYFDWSIQQCLTVLKPNIKWFVRKDFFKFFFASHAALPLCWTLKDVSETNQPHSTLGFTHSALITIRIQSIWEVRVRLNAAGK